MSIYPDQIHGNSLLKSTDDTTIPQKPLVLGVSVSIGEKTNIPVIIVRFLIVAVTFWSIFWPGLIIWPIVVLYLVAGGIKYVFDKKTTKTFFDSTLEDIKNNKEPFDSIMEMKSCSLPEVQNQINILKIQLLDIQEEFAIKFIDLQKNIEQLELQLSGSKKNGLIESNQKKHIDANMQHVDTKPVAETLENVAQKTPTPLPAHFLKQTPPNRVVVQKKETIVEKKHTTFEMSKKNDSEKHIIEKQNTDRTKNYEAKEAVGNVKKRVLTMMSIPLVEFIFGSFSSVFDKVGEVYSHYRNQGKLPVFFMTVSGIITLVFGMGYLLQYSFSNYFTPLIKVIFGFGCSTFLLVVGMRLCKHQKYREYASTLIGASSILNYLCIYFLTITYGFVVPLIGFSLLGLNTLMSYIFAKIYETKIVSVVAFLGGAFTPFLLGVEAAQPLYYIYYLLIIAYATLYLARTIEWSHFAHGSFLVITAIIEYVLTNSNTDFHLLPTAFSFHCLFYLYLYHCFFEGKKFRSSFNAVTAVLLVANTFVFFYNIHYLFAYTKILGFILLGNSIPFFLFAVVVWKAVTHQRKALFITFIAGLVGLAIPALLGVDLTGMLWVLEGLFLVYIGFLFALPSIRKEGYGVFALALGNILYMQLEYMDIWPDVTDGSAYWIFASMGFILSMFCVVIKTYFKVISAFEKVLYKIAKEVLAVWFLLLWIVTVFAYIPEYAILVLYIPLICMWVFVNNNELRLSRFIVFSGISVLILATIIISINEYQLIWSKIYGQIYYWDFVAIGIASQLIFLTSKLVFRRNDKFDKAYLAFLQETYSLWLIIIVSYTSYALFPQWILVFTLFPCLYVIYRSSKKELFLSQLLSLPTITILSIIIIIKMVITVIESEFPATLMSPAYSQIVLLFVFILTITFLLKHKIITLSALIHEKYLKVYKEILSIVILGLFLLTFAAISMKWFFCLSIVPLFIIFYRGVKISSLFSQIIATLLSILPVAGVLIAGYNIGSLYFLDLPWEGRIALVEFSALLWGYIRFVSSINARHEFILLGNILRTVFYLLIPLFFIPQVVDRGLPFTALALWGSVIISYFLHKVVKQKILFYEFKLIWIVAIIYTLFTCLVNYTGSIYSSYTAALFLSVLLGIIFLFVEHGFFNEKYMKSDYKDLLVGYWIYFGLAVSLTMYGLWHNVSLTIVSAVFFWFGLVWIRPMPVSVKSTWKSFYYVVKIGCAINLLLYGLGVGQFASLSFSILIALFSVIISSVLVYGSNHLYKLIYKNRAIKKTGVYSIDLWINHLFIALLYTRTLLLFSSDIVQPLLSIALLLHALVLTFHSYPMKYRSLIKFALGLYGVLVVKVVFFDMRDFNVLQKVIGFMVIAVLLLSGAFLIQRFGVWGIKEKNVEKLPRNIE